MSMQTIETGHQGTATHDGEAFVIERVFAAPREVVFKAWTEREQLMRWFGPKGFTMPAATLDLRPGGIFHYHLRSPDGHELWGRWVFREITAPERLVFVVSFSDKAGGVTRNPWDAGWPLQTLSTVSFEPRGERTEVTVRWTPLEASEAERRTFAEGRPSMQQGWSGTFDQFGEYLARA